MTEEKKTNGQILDDSRRKALEKETMEGLRQEASDALSERDEFLGAVFEKSLSGLAIVDLSGRYIDVNPAMCRMFGYSREEFLSNDISLLLFPEDAALSFEFCAKMWREGGFVPALRLRSKGGKEILAEGTVSPFTIGKKEYALGMFTDVTLKNILFKTLKEERDFARHCLDIAGTVITVVNSDQTVTMINKKGCEILNLREGEISGRNWFDSFVPASEREQAASVFRKLITGEMTRIEYFEGRVLTGSGASRLIAWRSEALKDSCGNIYAVLSSGEDITERNQAGGEFARSAHEPESSVAGRTEELKKNEEILRAILDNSSAAIYIKDADGRYLLVNKGYERLFNVTRGQLAGKSDYDIFPKDIADRFRQNDHEVIEAGKGIEFEEEAVHPDGSTHTYISIKFPIRGIQGAICGISTDITERKKIEKAVSSSAALMQEAQHLAKFGNWEWDITTNKIYWSDEIYRIFGVERGTEVTYDIFLNTIHPDDREFLKRSIDEALTEKKPYDIDHRIVLSAGAERIVHERAEVSFTSEGTPVRMVGTVQDITERKRTEEELLKADKLESIGVLAAGIAHDFNNLLLGILGNVTLARNFFKPDDRMAAILADIERASLRAKNLTRQLLTFSKGGMPIRETTRIEQLVKDSAGLVLRGSKVRCEYAFPGDLRPVEIDEGQVTQVINNIILNAQQAMPDGGTISVDARNADVKEEDRLPLKAGRYVKLSFRDKGQGIPKAILGKVFDPFFTTKQKASGLGLAVSYSIIKKHNGYISVESREGEGTVFHIYLPSPEKETGARNEEKIVKGKGRILVMDDEEMVRDVSGEMLSLLGYEPAFAVDGKETLEVFRKAKEEGKPFDAVILDLTIPGGMGGKETLRQLIEIDPGVKAIVSSGYSQDPIMSEYSHFGFAGVIAKPYRVSDFSKIVNQVLGSK